MTAFIAPRQSLSVTTALLAAPGLIAAAIGVFGVVGAVSAIVPLVLGCVTVPVADTVSLGQRSGAYGVPLGFVVAVDLAWVAWLVAEFTSSDGIPWGWLVAIGAYLAACTWNAVRVLRRGEEIKQWHVEHEAATRARTEVVWADAGGGTSGGVAELPVAAARQPRGPDDQ